MPFSHTKINFFLLFFCSRLGPKFLLKISLQNGGTHPVVQVNIFISEGFFDLLFPFCSLLPILLLYCHLWHFLIILSKFKLFRRIISCISCFNMILQVIIFLFYFSVVSLCITYFSFILYFSFFIFFILFYLFFYFMFFI